MTSSITRSPIGAQDLYPWDGDGADLRFARTTQEGYTINLNPVFYQVDALVAFGGGVNYNYDTLYDCVTAQGSDERDVILRPGTWDIDTNLTIAANINLVVPNGVMLTPASGITVTINGTVTAGPYQWIDESSGGTVTLNSYPQDAAWKGSAENLSVTALTVNGVPVTGGNLQVSATNRIIGRISAGAGDSEELTAAQVLAMLSLDTLTGSIALWPLDDPPTGYLECDGSSLPRATYASLFAVIGTTYGAADSSHFNIPDLRGRFLRGWDHSAGLDPDSAARTAVTATGATMTAGDHVGTEQADAFEAHVHTEGISWGSGAQSGSGAQGSAATADTGSAGGNETRPANTYVMFCIKY